MKKLLLFILVLLCKSVAGQTSSLQTDSITNEYTIRYNKLKELYIKKIDSESYKTANSLLSSFVKKTHMRKLTDMPMLVWIKLNLYITEFKSFEEAQKEWDAVEAAQEIEFEENTEYYDYVFESMMKTSVDIHINSEQEVRMEHPEKFR